MRKIALTVFLAFSFCAVLFAQDDAKSRMNSIKKSPAYIYGEATLASVEDATDAARETLLYNLKNALKNNDEGLALKDVNPEELVASCEILSTPRGSMFRVLGFIHKSAFSDYVEDVVESVPASSTGTEQASAAVEAAPASGVKDVFEDKMRQINDLFILYSVLDSDEWSSKVKYGKVKTDTSPDLLSASYLVVFSPDDYVIKAVMTPKDGVRNNIATGKQDSTRQYPNCQAVWVSLTY